MSWLNRFAEPNLFNVLLWIPAHSRQTRFEIVAGLTVITMMIYAISNRVRDKIRPRLIGFEMAPSVSSALNILDRWNLREKRRSRTAVVVDFFFIPALTILIAYLCFWAALSVPYEVPWLSGAGVLMGWAALVALPSAWIEDLAILWSMHVADGKHQRNGSERNPASKSVFLTRFFAILKYGILATSTALLLCRLEYLVYQLIEPVVRHHPRSTLTALAVLSAGFGIWMLQLANPLHPSLLMLHLAPSREAANRVLSRWGVKRQRDALWANRVDIVFAILSTQTLAFLFFRLAGRIGTPPPIASMSQSVGWYMLLAGACHVVQNCGAEAALRETKMGWRIHICRACGGLRVLLLFLGALWGAVLWLRWEGELITRVLSAIQAAAGAGR